VTRLAWVLRDLPVELIGRIRGDRVMRLPKPPRVYDPKGGRPPKHGPEFRFAKPETWPDPAIITHTATTNYGKAVTQAWDRVHPRLTHRAAWLDHEGELPLIEGTLIRLEVEHLSKDREAPAVWLWSSRTGSSDADVDRAWQAFLRRFDLKHTFRLFKQTRKDALEEYSPIRYDDRVNCLARRKLSCSVGQLCAELKVDATVAGFEILHLVRTPQEEGNLVADRSLEEQGTLLRIRCPPFEVERVREWVFFSGDCVVPLGKRAVRRKVLATPGVNADDVSVCLSVPNVDREFSAEPVKGKHRETPRESANQFRA
jgi:DDE superfamily endonuclease